MGGGRGAGMGILGGGQQGKNQESRTLLTENSQKKKVEKKDPRGVVL